jgi:hypothetical protein
LEIASTVRVIVLVLSVGATTTAISTTAAVSTATAISASAATATTITTAAAAVSAATATAWTVVLGASFVARDSASCDFLRIQFIDCSFRFVRIGHFHESKTARATSFPIRNDTNLGDLAKPTESLSNLVFRSAERQVTYINIRH